MRTVIAIAIFLGVLVFADLLVNDGNLAEPVWKLIVGWLR